MVLALHCNVLSNVTKTVHFICFVQRVLTHFSCDSVVRFASFEYPEQKILRILCNIRLSLYKITLLWNWIQFSELNTFNTRRVRSLKSMATAISRIDQCIPWSFFTWQLNSQHLSGISLKVRCAFLWIWINPGIHLTWSL